MIAELFNGNPEKRRIKEAEKVFSLTNPTYDSTVHKYIKDWNEALKIMENSEFKDMYSPEDAKECIQERCYKEMKKKASGGFKNSLDNMFNGNEFVPLADILPSDISKPEIYKYCFNKELAPYLEKAYQKLNEMKDRLEKEKYRHDVLSDFNDKIDAIDKLVKDFDPKTFKLVDNVNHIDESDIFKLAANYGCGLMSAMAKAKAKKISQNSELAVYDETRQFVEKYAKRAGIDEDEIKDVFAQLDEKFYDKVNSFREIACRNKDRLYNKALKATSMLVKDHYQKAEKKFIDFSRKYGAILEKDEETLGNAINKIEQARFGSPKKEDYSKILENLEKETVDVYEVEA
jgi:TolA-binding protein